MKKKISPTKVARKIADQLLSEMRIHEELHPTGRITPSLVHIKTFLAVRRMLRNALK